MIETIRAAFVIARRDFTAIIFSKSFFFFLLGQIRYQSGTNISQASIPSALHHSRNRPSSSAAADERFCSVSGGSCSPSRLIEWPPASSRMARPAA